MNTPLFTREDAGRALPGARYRVGGFWRRSAAALLDLIVLFPFLLFCTGLTAMLGGEAQPTTAEIGPGYFVSLALNGGVIGLAAVAMSGVVILLYFFLFHTLQGQTVGKRLLGLHVIDVYGVRPSALRALIRTFGYGVSALLFSLGFFWVGFDREKRGLHDWLAGTYVVRSPLPAMATGGSGAGLERAR